MIDVEAGSVSAARPDWEAIRDEIHCPLCQYNLRGLIEPRCPECGFRFAWFEVLDPRRRQHDFLFEHHPERNIVSFFRTLIAGLRPRRFWTALHPFQRISAARLRLYALLTVLPCVVAFSLISRFEIARARYFLPSFNWKDVLELLLSDWTFYVVVFPLAWPWVVFAALMIFQASMRRARINRAHVLRCVVYSHDVFFHLGLAAIILFGMFLYTLSRDIEGLLAILFVLWAMAMAMASLSLYFAYKLYLRFDRPGWTVLSAVVIAALVEANAYLILEFWL